MHSFLSFDMQAGSFACWSLFSILLPSDIWRSLLSSRFKFVSNCRQFLCWYSLHNQNNILDLNITFNIFLLPSNTNTGSIPCARSLQTLFTITSTKSSEFEPSKFWFVGCCIACTMKSSALANTALWIHPDASTANRQPENVSIAICRAKNVLNNAFQYFNREIKVTYRLHHFVYKSK